jgi:ketosteroid isomerase-like protein
MSERNLDIVRQIYAGWEVGDFKAGQEHFAEDIVLVLDFGPNERTARGRAAMREMWRDELDNWDYLRIGEVCEIREIGDCVVVRNSIHANGRQSGAEVEIADGGAAFRFAEGKIVWLMATGSIRNAEQAISRAG